MQLKHTSHRLSSCLFTTVTRMQTVSAVSKKPSVLVGTVTDQPSHTCPTLCMFVSVDVCVMLSAPVNCVINGFSCLPHLEPSWKAADPSPSGLQLVKLPSFAAWPWAVFSFTTLLFFSWNSGYWLEREEKQVKENNWNSSTNALERKSENTTWQ